MVYRDKRGRFSKPRDNRGRYIQRVEVEVEPEIEDYEPFWSPADRDRFADNLWFGVAAFLMFVVLAYAVITAVF